jgi:hypothetical protein
MGTTICLSGSAIHYYAKARHWISNLEFFKTKAAFFYRLLNDYFIPVVDPVPMEAIKLTVSKLFILEEDEDHAIRSVGDQLKQLELISENIIPENQEELGNLMAKLNQEYTIKNGLFALLKAQSGIPNLFQTNILNQ